MNIQWVTARRRYLAQQGAKDAEFNESEHPRADDGKFGIRSGSGSKSSKNLSSSEEYAIHHYVQPSDSPTGFLNLNKSLRSGKTLSSDQKIQVERLDSAIQKSPKFEGRTYRGVRFDSPTEKEAFLEAHAEGKEVEMSQYTSTSKNSSVASGSVRIVMEGRSGADISEISKDKAEQEVLYPRNTKFKVTRVAKDKNGGMIIGMREV